jgi:hypothetical protein
LADVFADPDDEATPASERTSADEDRALPTALPPRFIGLDDDHAAVVDLMIARQGMIPRSELEAEMSRRGMFFDGALETINDWAFGRFDEPLIEEGDPCIVPKHLLSELLETSEAT